MLAIQILNVSIDAIDFKPFQSNLVLSEFNDQNSITEFITEQVLGYKNLFPESCSKSQKQNSLQKHACIKLINGDLPIALQENTASLSVYTSSETKSYLYMFLQEINPPPPKI